MTNLHPKSIYIVKDYSLDDHYFDDKIDFFPKGQEIFTKLTQVVSLSFITFTEEILFLFVIVLFCQQLEEAMDRIRFFAEECDRVQERKLFFDIIWTT